MEQKALSVARNLAERYLRELRGDVVDGQTLAKAVLAGYLCGSGVPSDQAVAAVEKMGAKNLVGPLPMNPMYHGIPWIVPGPVSGAPYYASR